MSVKCVVTKYNGPKYLRDPISRETFKKSAHREAEKDSDCHTDLTKIQQTKNSMEIRNAVSKAAKPVIRYNEQISLFEGYSLDSPSLSIIDEVF